VLSVMRRIGSQGAAEGAHCVLRRAKNLAARTLRLAD
jgi:hypothetical protein